MTSQQHRLAAMAMVLSAVISGIGCQDKQATPQPKPAPAKKTDAGGKTVDAGNNPSRDAGAPDVPAGTPDAGTTPTGAGGTTARRPDGHGRHGRDDRAADDGHGRNDRAADDGHGRDDHAAADGHGRDDRAAADGRGAEHAADDHAAGGPLRIAAFGDYGVDNSDEGDVADLVHGWKPDHVITLGDNNYSSGEARRRSTRTSASTITTSSATTGAASAPAARPTGSGRRPAITTGLRPNLKPYTDYFTLPGNERYYDVDLGPGAPLRDGQRQHEPDGIQGDLEAGAVAQGQAGRVEVLLRPRLLPPPAVFDRAITAATPTCAGRSRRGARRRCWPATITTTSASRSAASRTSSNGLGRGRHLQVHEEPRCPRRSSATTDKHGAMLITATTSRHHVRVLDPRRPEARQLDRAKDLQLTCRLLASTRECAAERRSTHASSLFRIAPRHGATGLHGRGRRWHGGSGSGKDDDR